LSRFFYKRKRKRNIVEELQESTQDKKSVPKKKDLIILLLILALISTIAFFYFTNREQIKNEQEVKVEVEKTEIKSVDDKTFILLGLGDTIDISKNIQSKFSTINKSNFDNLLFTKKSEMSYSTDSTKILIYSQLYIKDSIYSEFGNLRDTINISSKEILIDSLGWIGFNSKGLIQSKDE